MFSGIRVVKAFRMEERELEDFREANQNWITRSMSVVRAKAMTEGITHFLTYAGFVILLCGFRLRPDPERRPLRPGLAHDLGGRLLHDVSAREADLEGLPNGARDRWGPPSAPLPKCWICRRRRCRARAARASSAARSRARIRNVGFAYDGEPVLSGLSFHAKAGRRSRSSAPRGQGVDAHRPRGPLLRSRVGRNLGERHRHPRARSRCVVCELGAGRPAPVLFHASIRENVAYGEAQSIRRGDPLGAPCGESPRFHPRRSPRDINRGGGPRRAPLRRPAPAAHDPRARSSRIRQSYFWTR